MTAIALLVAASMVAGRAARATSLTTVQPEPAPPPASAVNGGPPSGILHDRVVSLAHAERFDGAPGAPVATGALLRQLVFELDHAASPGAWRPDLGALVARMARPAPAGTARLALVDVRYDRLRPGTSARVGMGYETARVFAFAPLDGATRRGSRVAFLLDGGDALSNDAVPGARLEIDCDDGLGFRPLEPGTPAVARYTTAGTRTLRLRLLRPDGGALEAAAVFEVSSLASPTPHDTLHVTATDAYAGVYGTGEAYVYRAAGHAGIVKPVVLIEGFDLQNTMHWDELWQLLNQQGVGDSLHAAGFDLVVLDFTDATTDLERNALVVEQLVRQVRALSPPSASMALVGSSMGGLCARYALADLETRGEPHSVRSFISFDAPHRGANLPLGVQYWTRFFANLSAEAQRMVDLFNSPAAREMLVYHYTNPPSASPAADPLRATFLQHLAAVGGNPAATRSVAIANGSGRGVGLDFAPGDQLVRYEYDTSDVGVRGNVWALPDGGTQTIFDGLQRFGPFTTARQTVTVSGTLPYDGAPGGTRATMAEMDSASSPYGDIVALHPSHCFVPTVSALDLNVAGLFYDLSADPDPLDHTWFDEIHAPAENQEHVTLSPEGAGWVLAEIERGVAAAAEPVARKSRLLAPRPNPSRGETALGFSLAYPTTVRLAVWSVNGRLVRVLVEGARPAGHAVVAWDGRDGGGRAVASGVYFVRLDADGASDIRRVVRLR